MTTSGLSERFTVLYTDMPLSVVSVRPHKWRGHWALLSEAEIAAKESEEPAAVPRNRGGSPFLAVSWLSRWSGAVQMYWLAAGSGT